MLFGAFGDIHGDFAHARRAIERHPDVRFWVSVGDIATDTGMYEPLGAPVYWIHGNNDNFDAIASGELPPDFHYIASGTAVDVGRVFRLRETLRRTAEASAEAVRPAISLSVAGLGGTFAPTWYETRASDLPHPRKGSARATELADKRRHFVREEVDACKQLRGIDVLLTHEAAKPFRPFPGGRGPDAGKEAINEVLREMQPRLHLFGHHHRFSTQTREGVESVGLDLVSRSYLIIDAGSLKYVCHANA